MELHGTVKGVTESDDNPGTVLVTVYVDEFDSTISFPVAFDKAGKWPFGKAVVFPMRAAPRKAKGGE